MDYTGIINIVLVTIIYSTFISPNLKKLGSIRDEIIDMEFPVYDTEDYDKAIEKAGISLKKKLTRYSDTYNEILEFLKYFYCIIGGLLVVQLLIFIRSNDHTIAEWSPLIATTLVVIILVFTLRRYMLKPWKISSIRWLINKGVAEINVNKIFDPQLTINQRVNNVVNDDELTNISIDSKVKLVGYRYILTIENVNGERLYYVSAGLVSKQARVMKIVSRAGSTRHDINIASMKLKPNNYRARLIFFNSPFGGKYVPSETSIEFSVDPQTDRVNPEPINLLVQSKRIESNMKDGKIASLTVKEGNPGDTSLVSILTSRSFQRVIGNVNRPVILENYNGNLGRYEIDKYCSRQNVAVQKSKEFFIRLFNIVRRNNNDPYVALVPKRKR